MYLLEILELYAASAWVVTSSDRNYVSLELSLPVIYRFMSPSESPVAQMVDRLAISHRAIPVVYNHLVHFRHIRKRPAAIFNYVLMVEMSISDKIHRLI